LLFSLGNGSGDRKENPSMHGDRVIDETTVRYSGKSSQEQAFHGAGDGKVGVAIFYLLEFGT